MPYTTPSDVRMVIHTDLTDTDITQQIIQTDTEIDKHWGFVTFNYHFHLTVSTVYLMVLYGVS